MRHKSYFILAILLIILDQISKIWIANNFALGEIFVLNQFINITYLQNSGAAFSMLADWQHSRYLLPLISIIAVVFLSIWLLKTNPKKTLRMLSITFILAGAFGNFIDRLFYGFVVDMVSLHYDEHYFAVFNIADSLISFAVLIILFDKDNNNG